MATATTHPAVRQDRYLSVSQPIRTSGNTTCFFVYAVEQIYAVLDSFSGACQLSLRGHSAAAARWCISRQPYGARKLTY